jgi:hypothetical protein
MSWFCMGLSTPPDLPGMLPEGDNTVTEMSPGFAHQAHFQLHGSMVTYREASMVMETFGEMCFRWQRGVDAPWSPSNENQSTC